MKKFLLSVLCGLLALVLIACSGASDGGANNGDDGDANDEAAAVELYGQKISGEEGMARLEELEALYLNSDAFKEFASDKLSWTQTVTVGETVITSSFHYSKVDRYYMSDLETTNLSEYEFDQETNQYTDTLIWKTILSESTDYVYIDQNGRMIDATHSYAMYEDYVPEYKREEQSSNTYHEYEASVAQEKFEERTDYMDIFSGYFQYVNQMFSTFKPVLEMGSFSTDGMSVEVRSKGENHLYLKYEMDMYGMKTEMECVFENGYITYIKMTVPNTQNIPGVDQNGYLAKMGGTMVTEIRLYPGTCTITYPNLGLYEKVE